MIIEVDRNNVSEAAGVHSVSWQESHRSFCAPEFIELHSPKRQEKYILEKMESGSRFYMLIDDGPAGVVSVNGSLIEDLYILPGKQNMGFGTLLLEFAVKKCAGAPCLWILENNDRARRFYENKGFKETGRVNSITDKLSEIEFSLV